MFCCCGIALARVGAFTSIHGPVSPLTWNSFLPDLSPFWAVALWICAMPFESITCPLNLLYPLSRVCPQRLSPVYWMYPLILCPQSPGWHCPPVAASRPSWTPRTNGKTLHWCMLVNIAGHTRAVASCSQCMVHSWLQCKEVYFHQYPMFTICYNRFWSFSLNNIYDEFLMTV